MLGQERSRAQEITSTEPLRVRGCVLGAFQQQGWGLRARAGGSGRWAVCQCMLSVTGNHRKGWCTWSRASYFW